MVLRVLRHVVFVDEEERHEVLALVADDHGVLDVGAELQLVLDVGRRDVLAASGDDDVLLAVHNPEIFVLPGADVAGVEPAFPVDRLRGELRVLEVALEDVGPAREDLAVIGQRHLDAGHRLPDRSDAWALDAVDGDHARRLGQPVSLDERDPEGVVVLEQLRRRRRRAAHSEMGAVEAEPPLERRQGRPVGQAIRDRQRDRHALLAELGPRVATPDRHGQTVRRALEPRRVRHAQIDGRRELFPDPRHAREVRGRDLAEVLEERVQALDEVHHVARAERAEHRDQIFVDVGERKIRDDLVVLVHRVDRQERLRHPEDRAVREHRPLRRPGRPRGIDDHRGVPGAHGAQPLVDRGGVRLVERLSLLEEVLEEADPLVAESPEPLRIPDDDSLDTGLRDDRQDLVELLLVLDEDEPRLGVVQQVVDLVGARRRIDAARGAADRLDPEVAIEPLRSVFGQDGDIFPMPESEGQECRRHPVDLFTVLAPRDAMPDAVLLEPDRQPVPLPLHLLREQRRHAPRPVPNRGGHHHLLLLR